MSRPVKAITFDLWDTLFVDDSDEPKRAAQRLRPKSGERPYCVYESLRRHQDIPYEKVLLAHKVLAHDDLRTGRLVAPFALELPTQRSFQLVCPEAHERRPKVQSFCAWIAEEAGRLDDGPA